MSNTILTVPAWIAKDDIALFREKKGCVNSTRFHGYKAGELQFDTFAGVPKDGIWQGVYRFAAASGDESDKADFNALPGLTQGDDPDGGN